MNRDLLEEMFSQNPIYLWIFIFLCALMTRLVFYTGLFGSDEFVYAKQALTILHGDWGVSNYIGALRYGVNLPMAGFMAIFGVSEFSANLWALACSLGEVILVFIFAEKVWGRKVAVYSALLLALLPLHVHYAGRLMADAPLAFFITLTFVLFYFAEKKENIFYYLFAGLSLGAAYWIKESVAILMLPTFLIYAILTRQIKVAWLLIGLGFSIGVSLNLLFMWYISGNPLLMFDIQGKALSTTSANVTKIRDPLFYFKYLFFDVRHTWMLGPLALAGLIIWFKKGKIDWRGNTSYLIIWVLGIIAILSFTIVSFNPPVFIFKQTNYMLLFIAPLAILAGYFIAKVSFKWSMSILAVVFMGSLVLSALEQQAVRVFVSNSQAMVPYVKKEPDSIYFGTINAMHIIYGNDELSGQWPSKLQIFPIKNLLDGLPENLVSTNKNHRFYALVDYETMEWGGRMKSIAPNKIPKCWIQKEQIEPKGFGIGEVVVTSIIGITKIFLPSSMEKTVLGPFNALHRPRKAFIYEIPRNCEFNL